MQIRASKRRLLARSNLLSRQIVDRQKTYQRHPFLFNACAPILFFSIHNHERLTHHKAGLSSRSYCFQQRSTARQHIIYDQRAIS
jgi:hypothetical protein